MEKRAPLTIALIGLGDIAQKAYLPIMANHTQVKPVLCTRNKKTLKGLAGKYRIDSCYHDIDELFKSNLDAAMVHSVTESHFEIVHKLLSANIPTFVDKPLALSLQEAEKLLQLASQNQVNLYLGFNRRFAPLVRSLAKEKDAVQISWHKNRLMQPAPARDFIFNDFIHVVDGLRFLGNGKIEDLHVFSRLKKGVLESIHVQWQQKETLLTGTMNRVAGLTEERLEYYTPGNTWLFENLHSGLHYHDGSSTNLGFDHWESTLRKRGFVAMMEDWIGVVLNGQFDAGRIRDIYKTHELCEHILEKVMENSEKN